MVGTPVRRRPLEEEEAPKVAPRLEAIPIRQVREEAREKIGVELTRDQATAQAVVTTIQSMFDDAISKNADMEMRKEWKDASLSRLTKIPDLFKNCEVQYAYNQRQDVYSIKTTLDNRPRIITVRAGKEFTELSLADLQGNVLELARQEDGKGVTFNRMG